MGRGNRDAMSSWDLRYGEAIRGVICTSIDGGAGCGFYGERCYAPSTMVPRCISSAVA